MKRLAGKKVIITGAAQGLGQALVRRMTDEGAKVVIGDINISEALATAQEIVESEAFLLDVADYKSCEKFISDAVEVLGGIDILVSNAAIVIPGAVGEIDAVSWKKVIEVNLCGFFNIVKAAVPFINKGTGAIIQINSKSGKMGSLKNSAYAASKFGGIGLIQSLAMELAPVKIRVNGICPGDLLESPLWVNHLFKDYSKNWGIPQEQLKQTCIEKVPLKRTCRYEDVANLLVFLSSDEASYMTGQAINVTGGVLMH